MKPATGSISDITTQGRNKKILFDEDGEVMDGAAEDIKSEEDVPKLSGVEDDDENDYFVKREKQRQKQKDENDEADTNKKWFNVFTEYPSTDEVLDMKESEQIELYNLCKNSFEAEMPTFSKHNASDARWLQTALRKGTAKDRANAGALLVTSNALANLDINTGRFVEESFAAAASQTFSLQMRGADWKLVRKNTTLSKDKQRRIYAYWYFENELKEHYFEFLRNLQQAIQTGQEHNKNAAIVAASQLLSYAPEKEQMLLTMLINKLGDPTAKVASKALHHLSEVAHRHPNMCGVIVAESEKLLFRNNISERAQHFALCFLASIAPSGRPEVCSKLVNICFALFKVLVQKGAVNNRTMQAILRCLQKAILEAKPAEGSTEILNKDMQDTIYRLVHLADIRVSVQTLGLLLQMLTVKTEKSDRFYNALYKKMHDLEVVNIGAKTAAQLLHIIHRAIHIDSNVQRAQAFIKRLLQCSLYVPSNMAAGCLIVIHKLLRSRKELAGGVSPYGKEEKSGNDLTTLPQVEVTDAELAKFDSDGEEKYEDIRNEDDANDEENVNKKQPTSIKSSWHHAKVESTATEGKVREIAPSKYDPYHRVPSYAGAEFALRDELLLLREHYHPTVQVFAENLLNQSQKLDNQKDETPTISHKRYVAFGARGKPIKNLTKSNCTEDEMYIFNFLEQKRLQTVSNKTKKLTEVEDEDDEMLKEGEIGDDEFEEYLGSYFGKKAKAAADAVDEEDEELDFLKALGGELKPEIKKTKKGAAKDDDGDGVEDIDADWGDDDIEEGDFAGDSDVSADEDGSIDGNFDDDDNDDDDDGSISLDEDGAPADISDEEDGDSMSEDMSGDEDEDDDDSGLPSANGKKARKRSLTLDGKSFAKKLKHSDDMSSLFAAADDFAELLEETGKTKGQGTSHAVFNKDKSSAKQMKWEEKRHSNSKSYTKRSKKGGINKKNIKKHR
ncbi:unnamed protein product [Ceratitis capitata]|uniref:(Mediterranean fruit fly) hypothetical protein n=1 Tax=Ceratitis capitata TaxID=7213 RepID=A0A811V466_CERCA|nr:unnamed protein product [Ceratitis capitata]